MTSNCSCQVDYYGPYCEWYKGCLYYKCLNGGKCIGNAQPPYCSCAFNYVGLTCNISATGCALQGNYSCQNGICNNITGICNCSSNFTGSTCSICMY